MFSRAKHLKLTGLISLAAVTVSFLSACSSAPIDERERGPASALEGSKYKPFKTEFESATALNSYIGQLGYNMEKYSKAAVVAKWAALAPQDVRKEFSQKPEGFDIGYHRSRVNGHSSLIRVITQANNASDINQNAISFTPEGPFNEGSDQDHDRAVIAAALPAIERDLPELVAQIMREHHYESRHLNGQAFSRIELVTQLALLLPEAINAKYLGLSRLNPVKAREWAHAWRDKQDFNLVSDPRVAFKAQTALAEAAAARASLGTPLNPIEILHVVSRSQWTETAITLAIDTLLKNPKALEQARLASQQGRANELDAVITEALRFEPVLPYQVFYAKDDVALRSGLTFKKGQSAFVLNSVANRDSGVTKPTGFSGYADGDPTLRLMQDEVHAAVAAVVALPGLRRASGDQGNLERRAVIEAASTPLTYDQFRYSYPESLVIESDIVEPTKAFQITSPDDLYEDYLNDYDRDEFRLCVSGQLPDHYENRIKRDNRDFFFCRLAKPFRNCVTGEAAAGHYPYLAKGPKAHAAYQKCSAAHPLTPTEAAFYPAVMYGEALNESQLNTSQAQRTSGPDYKFEDYLKFYNHETARESLLNAVGMLKFNNRDMLFYVRLNLDFRDCIGTPVVSHDVAAKVGVQIFRDLAAQYAYCRDGVWNQDSLRREGALSDEDRYFYETNILAHQK